MTKIEPTGSDNRTIVFGDKLRWLPPKWLFNLMAWLGYRPAPVQALTDASMFLLPQWMYAVAKLGIPDLLATRVLTSEEIAAHTEACPDRIDRLLHAMCQCGYFKVEETSSNFKWANTSKSEVLIATHPNTIRPLLFHWIEDCYGPASRILDALSSDKSAFELYHGQHGMDFFTDYLSARPNSHQQFADAMTASSAFTDRAVIEDVDWVRFKTVIDVGGSCGSFIVPLITRHSTLTATIFDLPSVVERSEQVLADRQGLVSDRLNFEAGDFFKADTIPELDPGSAFVLRNILHDWSDEKCVQILTNLASAMRCDSSRIMLIELGRSGGRERSSLERGRTTIDLLMMTMFAGKERTLDEFKYLFKAAGLKLVAVHRTRSIAQVVEAKLAAAG